jgi:hypothetical protein
MSKSGRIFTISVHDFTCLFTNDLLVISYKKTPHIRNIFHSVKYYLTNLHIYQKSSVTEKFSGLY